MRNCVLITLVFLGAVPLFGAAAEIFSGEDEMLSKLSPRELATYVELKILMNPLQMRQYVTLPTAEDRYAWVKHFWIERDPTPATDKNERKIEHEKRVLLARNYFPWPSIPGWDDRGETLIRWGFPSYRAKMPGSVDLRGVVPPEELWYYEAYDLVIRFKDFTLTEHYVYASGAMDKALSSLDEIRNAQRLTERSGKSEEERLSPKKFIIPEDLKNVLNNTDPNEIDYWSDPALRSMLSTESRMRNLITEFEHEKVKNPEGNFERFLAEHPLIHQCDLDQNTLPLYFDIVRFKGEKGALRTEVSFEVPAKEIAFITQHGENAADVEFKVLVRDYGRNKVACGEDSFRATARGNASSAPTLLPGQVVLSLEPGYYRVGLEAYDKNSKKSAGVTTSIRLAPFGSSLAVSDIQFASGIREVDASRKFVKRGLWVVPHPQRGYRKPAPVNFYFEIYGLDTDREGLAFYRIEYTIVPLEKRRWGPVLTEVHATISSSFETSGYGATQPQRLSIATDELWEGPFRLMVTVTDRRIFTTATQAAEFSILK